MTPSLRPTDYAGRFSCIGPACTDTCCAHWTIPLDPACHERFTRLPEGSLKADLMQSIVVQTPPSPHFAILQLTSGQHCPMHRADGLCRIQAEQGEAMLPRICQQYPRYKHSFEGGQEVGLALSCPEAARLVLLAPELLVARPAERTTASADLPQPEATQPKAELPLWAGSVRSLVLWILTEAPGYSLWQQLFLIRLLCYRLDGLRTTGKPEQTPALLEGFRQSISAGLPRPALEALPANAPDQLDMLLQLAGLMLADSRIAPGFETCVHRFTAGIGHGPGATLSSLAAGYEAARDRWLAPWLGQHPHLLRNWLINAMVRHRFPFAADGVGSGEARPRNGSARATEPLSAVEQFDGLAANFLLVRGLLTGVAGFHREQFSATHAVDTIQVAARHFEHHPGFLARARTAVREAGLASGEGMAILLRDEAVQRRPLPIGTENHPAAEPPQWPAISAPRASLPISVTPASTTATTPTVAANTNG